MRIVLDLQGGQNSSRFRGIGRYSMSLARQMVRDGGARHEFHVLLNRNLPEGLAEAAAAFDGLLPRSQIHVLELPSPTVEMVAENAWRTRAAELVREAALDRLRPDLVHVASLFEGYDDNCISSVGALGESIPTAITLYDMIPLLQPEIYLGSPLARRWYYRKAQFARRADLLLAISDSSAAEGQAVLAVPRQRIVAVGTGIDAKFRPVRMNPEEAEALLWRYRLGKPFILYAGASDPRKNLNGLMTAFASLPAPLRRRHRLAIAGKLKPDDVARIEGQAKAAGLASDELALLDFIPDDDLIRLYALCAVFVFPSFHEGFGLPLAEAMACGAAVLGSDRTSMPEVIGRADALFDPASPASIAERLARVLGDPAFRDDLRRHGPIQAQRFTWKDVAARSLAAFERVHEERRPAGPAGARVRLPTVAFVSALPPDGQGSGAYAARLLTELATFCDVTCITTQPGTAQHSTGDAWLEATAPIRPLGWLRDHDFDHVIYTLADATVTPELLEMIQARPGCAVLHDAALSGILARMSEQEATRLLYRAHGWHAALFARRHGIAAAAARFDCLQPFLEDMALVITHLPALAGAVRKRLHRGGPEIMAVPPPPGAFWRPDRAEARARLGLAMDGFVACSVVIGDAAAQQQALDGWLSMVDAGLSDTLLFACGLAAPDVAAAVADDVAAFGAERTRVTGTMRDALAAADIVLQLGALPGAEAVTLLPDVLRACVPVLTDNPAAWNAWPTEAIACLPPCPDGAVIAEALGGLRADLARRVRMTEQLRAHAESWPAEGDLRTAVAKAEWLQTSAQQLRNKLRALTETYPAADVGLAEANVRANRAPTGPARLFIDVSVLSIRDAGSGIQRVCRSILAELMTDPPAGYRAEPIRWSGDNYVYARQYAHRLFGLPGRPADEAVHANAGDIYLGVDLVMETISDAVPWFEAQRLRGMRTVFVFYDLLPARRPDMFPPLIGPLYRNWISTVTELADGVIGISQAVMDELVVWLREHPPRRTRPLHLGWFHLGADLKASLPSMGQSGDPDMATRIFRQRDTFLSVGTIEPRKGYHQALAAFEALWAAGSDVNYAIVGGRGWMQEAFFHKLEAHPEFGRRLFWFRGLSDEVLAEMYREATALLAVSEAEGFGLPLIEAAKFGLPIIARDIPVFREVTAGHASFFDTLDGPELAGHLAKWLRQDAEYKTPQSAMMPSYTWRASARRLKQVMIDEDWSTVWTIGERVPRT